MFNSNSAASYNVAEGYEALYNNTADNNVAIGASALYRNTIGSYNVAVGYDALYSNVEAGQNVAVGYEALYTQSYSGYTANTAIGYAALYSNQPTSDGNRMSNTAVGAAALVGNTTGYDNTAVGLAAMYENQTGIQNTAMGEYALYFSNASGCVANGFSALGSNITGNYNTANGYSALGYTTSGTFNVADGANGLLTNTTGSSNSAIGMNALRNINGSRNTACGDSAGYNDNGGYYNTYIGYQANTGASSSLANAIAIGYGATVLYSNSAVVGNSNLTTFGIGAGAYAVPVQVNSAISGTVVSNGSQMLLLTGSAIGVLTITDPSSPKDGQLWEITTNQSSTPLAYTNPSNFVSAPTSVGANNPVRFFYSASLSLWVNQ